MTTDNTKVWILIVIGVLLGIFGIVKNEHSEYEYKAEYGDSYCYMNKEEYERYLSNQKRIKSGEIVYEVVDLERCVNK